MLLPPAPAASHGGEAEPGPPEVLHHHHHHSIPTLAARSHRPTHPTVAWRFPPARLPLPPRLASLVQPHQGHPLLGRCHRHCRQPRVPGSAPASSDVTRRWPTSTTSSTAWSGLPTARRSSSGSSELPCRHTHLYILLNSVRTERWTLQRRPRSSPSFVFNVKNWERF